MSKNKRVEQVKEALRQPYTFPGCYPKAFVVHDGLLCPKCVRQNIRAVFNDTRMNVGPWNITVDVIWEGEAYCVDCSTEIETAYGPLKKELAGSYDEAYEL
jgi:hypothetical protein